MSQALYVFGGIILGGLLNQWSSARADARRNRVQARGAARLLQRDVFNGVMLVHAALSSERWPLPEDQPSAMFTLNRFNMENWDRLGATFTASISDYDDWESVCVAFESMENENRMMGKGDSFDRDRLERVRDRDLMGALDVLDRLQTPLRRRIRRELRVRHVASDIFMPRERLGEARRLRDR